MEELMTKVNNTEIYLIKNSSLKEILSQHKEIDTILNPIFELKAKDNFFYNATKDFLRFYEINRNKIPYWINEYRTLFTRYSRNDKYLNILTAIPPLIIEDKIKYDNQNLQRLDHILNIIYQEGSWYLLLYDFNKGLFGYNTKEIVYQIMELVKVYEFGRVYIPI